MKIEHRLSENDEDQFDSSYVLKGLLSPEPQYRRCTPFADAQNRSGLNLPTQLTVV
jgi:hypothetical protein